MENHFDVNYELEMRLKEAGKDDLVSEIRQVASLANIHYVRQKRTKRLRKRYIMCTYLRWKRTVCYFIR